MAKAKEHKHTYDTVVEWETGFYWTPKSPAEVEMDLNKTYEEKVAEVDVEKFVRRTDGHIKRASRVMCSKCSKVILVKS